MSNKKRLVIFDADSMVFTVAYRFRDKKAKHLVTMNLNKYVSEVIKGANATHFIGFYGSKEEGAEPNFRYAIYDKYKANRPPTPEWVEKWRPALHETFKDKWGFIPVEGMEADDAVSIAYAHFKDEYDEIVVATEDKDLKQIPGAFWYGLKSHKIEKIEEFAGHRHLAIQTMSGDSTDNIPGLPGIGPKKAAKFVDGVKTIFGLRRAVMGAYENEFLALQKKLNAENNLVTKEDLIKDYADKGISLSEKQVIRKLKIANKGAGDAVYDTFVGGWKTYMKMNHSLVRLLTGLNEAPEGFELPEPTESMFNVAADDDTAEDARKELFGDVAEEGNSVLDEVVGGVSADDLPEDDGTNQAEADEAEFKEIPAKLSKDGSVPPITVTVSKPSSGGVMSL